MSACRSPRAKSLIDKLPKDKIPNMAKVFPSFIYNDGYGAAFAISTVSPWYNKNLPKPVESFADLWDERFRSRFMLITPKQTQSVQLLAVAASMVTGKPILEAQYELDKGWPKMMELKPNVQTIYDNFGTAVLQVVQGQADVGGPDFSKNILPYVMKGTPIAQSRPSEGSFAGVNCLTLVKGAPEPGAGCGLHRLGPLANGAEGHGRIHGRGAVRERHRPRCQDRRDRWPIRSRACAR